MCSLMSRSMKTIIRTLTIENRVVPIISKRMNSAVAWAMVSMVSVPFNMS